MYWCIIGLIGVLKHRFILGLKLVLKQVKKWDELWVFEKIKEPCETKMLWLIILDVRWYVGMFLMICKNMKLYFMDKIENRRFSKNRRTLPKLSFMI